MEYDTTAETEAGLALSWLADAPLFIDGPRWAPSTMPSSGQTTPKGL